MSSRRLRTDRQPANRLPSLRQWTPLGRALTAAGDHWTLAIVLQLGTRRMRLTHLHTRLPDMSPALLDRYLRQMVDRGLLTRTRFRERPPRVEVELSESGRELVPIARELARWGLRRMWSAPHEGERVDLDALLRLLVALVEEDAELPHGTLELVLAERAETVRHVLRIERGGVSLAATDVAHAERTPDLVSARIKGSRAAWIAALGPAGDRRQLRISGDLDLAAGVLDLLTVEA